MKFGIVGNNDGPLYLLKGLQKSDYRPEFVGLQKPVDQDLKVRYQTILGKTPFFEGFDEPKFLNDIADLEIELLINCFCNFRFQKILTLSFKTINIHLSLLPAYRGRHPLQWTLINGEKESGFSIHKMTQQFDAGEIYRQEKIILSKGMSVNELRTLLMSELQKKIADFLKRYDENSVQLKPNPESQATYAPRRTPKDSRLTEWQDSQKIFRKVMALRSEDYPAYIHTGNLKIICRNASLGSKINHELNKAFIYNIESNKFQVLCPDGQTIWLDCLQDRIKYLSLGQKLD